VLCNYGGLPVTAVIISITDYAFLLQINMLLLVIENEIEGKGNFMINAL